MTLGVQVTSINMNENLPSWWVAGIHDKELTVGILEHGVGSWEIIQNDHKLSFASIASGESTFLTLAFS